MNDQKPNMTIKLSMGKNYVMFGNRPDTGKWLERYYPTIEAARKFAEKRGWTVVVK